MGVARATRPRGLHAFAAGRSKGPYYSRARERTSDLEEPGDLGLSPARVRTS
jgi:hypothetical protein